MQVPEQQVILNAISLIFARSWSTASSSWFALLVRSKAEFPPTKIEATPAVRTPIMAIETSTSIREKAELEGARALLFRCRKFSFLVVLGRLCIQKKRVKLIDLASQSIGADPFGNWPISSSTWHGITVEPGKQVPGFEGIASVMFTPPSKSRSLVQTMPEKVEAPPNSVSAHGAHINIAEPEFPAISNC